jgi:hypothetical protein
VMKWPGERKRNKTIIRNWIKTGMTPGEVDGWQK